MRCPHTARLHRRLHRHHLPLRHQHTSTVGPTVCTPAMAASRWAMPGMPPSKAPLGPARTSRLPSRPRARPNLPWAAMMAMSADMALATTMPAMLASRSGSATGGSSRQRSEVWQAGVYSGFLRNQQMLVELHHRTEVSLKQQRLVNWRQLLQSAMGLGFRRNSALCRLSILGTASTLASGVGSCVVVDRLVRRSSL